MKRLDHPSRSPCRIQGSELYRDNGLYRVIKGIYSVYIGIMENQMETIRLGFVFLGFQGLRYRVQGFGPCLSLGFKV